jgi:uncharacterized protein YbjT (DUF2867 family)
MDLTKPILITGASGKTGRRAVAATAEKGGMVRAFLRRPEAGPELLQAGASEIAIGDLSDPSSLQRAPKAWDKSSTSARPCIRRRTRSRCR